MKPRNLTKESFIAYLNSFLTPESMVLDIGCGTKEVSNSLTCAKVTTIDSWRPFAPDLLCDLTLTPALPFADNTFDLVLMIDVIEHLPKEHGFRILEEAKRVSKKNLVLLTPLWWDPNLTEYSNPKSPYYQNEHNKHVSLWKVEDLLGFERYTSIEALNNYFFGVWRKAVKKIDIFFDISHVCNYRCPFCRSANLPNEVVMLEQIKDIDELLALAKSVDITGYGEVTRHPQFDKFLQYFTKFNVSVRFVTNGSNLTEEVVEQIINSTVSEVVISINSLSPETYKKVTGGKGNLSRVLAGVEQLIKRNDEAQKKIRIIFSFVMTQDTFPEIKEIVDFAKKYGKEASLLDLTPTIKDYTPDLLVPDTKENREYLASMMAYKDEIGAHVAMFRFDNRKAVDTAAVATEEKDEKALVEIVKGCDWVHTKAFILFGGNVGVCCWSDAVMGNILEQPFLEIWNGPKYQELRDCIKRGDLKYCKNCRRAG
jgi:MoaA/NifB/PqqE/SkfB family radical SAM enzyme